MKKLLILICIGVVTEVSSFAFDALLTDDTAAVVIGRPANYGAKTTLPVDASHNAMFNFDLSSLPGGTTVAGATLTVFIDAVSKAGAISLSTPGAAWSEDAIPAVAFTSLPGSQIAIVPLNSKNNFVRFDVTNLAKGWIGGTIPNHGIAINADASGHGVALTLDSKENTTTCHPAILEITTTGAGGTLDVYGDGSAGDYMSAAGTNATLDVSNPQFGNFTVQAGATLHIPSGTTIRCSGSFTNMGTIIIDPLGGLDTNEDLGTGTQPGISLRRASSVGYSPNGGTALPSLQLNALLSIGPVGGGSGGVSGSAVPIAAAGGGSLRIFAKQTIQNLGIIKAIGENGSDANVVGHILTSGGGGGGGVVILASANSLNLAGTLNVSGGNGGHAASSGNYVTLGGGGGGGGFVRLLAPSITVAPGTIILTAGSNGERLTGINVQYWQGGGGGASAGDGGSIYWDGTNLQQQSPKDGVYISDQCNPAALLIH